MPTSIAILAKAPIPGFAKTRLIPAIGAHAAAVLGGQLTEQTVATALATGIGPVTLWCAPDVTHGSFRDLAAHCPIHLARQPDGDLGIRMLAAFDGRPTLVIGSDCPALTPTHLYAAANAMNDAEIVLIPAEDGGYVLIGARGRHPEIFTDVVWSTDTVLSETRQRISALGLRATEFEPLWDIDTEDDLARMAREMPALAL